MPQKLTLTGTPVSPPRLVKSMMGKEASSTKVYSFEMKEGGSPAPAKSLPKASSIMFTVFVNEKQLRKAGLDEKTLMENKLLIQGELVVDINMKDCPGELGVTTNQMQIIPPKEKPAPVQEENKEEKSE